MKDFTLNYSQRFMKRRGNRKGLIAALAVAGVGAGIGAGMVITKKIKNFGKDNIIENFEENIEGIQDNKYVDSLDNRYKQTLLFRRDRVNKKVPKGIKGEK